MKKIKYIVILAALVCGLFVAPNNGFTLDMQMSDLFLTPNTNDFLGGYLGGLGPWNIDWSIANARPFSAKTDDMVFSTCIGSYDNGDNWIERMRITNEGNIGIGTYSPSEKLHVIGNVNISGSLTAKVTRTIKIPANAFSTSLTGDSRGIIFPSGYTNFVSATIPMPNDWDGSSNFKLTIFFKPITNSAGIVDFFVRVVGRCVGESMSDPGSTSSAGINVVSNSSNKLFKQSITILNSRFTVTDDVIHIYTIQRGGSEETFTDDVAFLAVEISYMAKR